MENSGDRSIRDTLLGSALAGVVAVTVLSVLSTMSLGSDLVQFGVALLFGVIAAQVYESRLA
jgi:preprotein translocase subunit SecF